MVYPMATRALSLLGRDHGVTVRILASVNGSSFLLPVELVEGSVAVDAKSPARRTLSCTVIADVGDAAVDPFASELRVEYGIVNPTSGQVYWTPVGTFVVTGAEDRGQGLVDVTGVDRWVRVKDARFERAVSTQGNTVTAIRNLLLEADSRIQVDTTAAPSGYTHRRMVWDRDRDEAVIELAASIGCIVWFDPLGVARVAPVAPLSSPPSWVVAGGEGGVKVRSTRGLTRDDTYNAVAVRGEPGGDAPAVHAVARDSSPSSRTRWGGPFGKKTRFYSSPTISTYAQAMAVAQSMLARAVGAAQSIALETIQHPGLDAGDVIQASLGSSYASLRVGSFSLTLGPGTTTITALSDTPALGGE